ncbi:MAG: hypothetical protein ACI9HI_000138, partial [Salinirussus sp.]
MPGIEHLIAPLRTADPLLVPLAVLVGVAVLGSLYELANPRGGDAAAYLLCAVAAGFCLLVGYTDGLAVGAAFTAVLALTVALPVALLYGVVGL